MSLRIEKLRLTLNQIPLVEDINIEVPEASFFSVIGPNGAGKSLLAKSILGLIEPSAGSIFLDEASPNKIPHTWIGYLPQVKSFDRRFPALTQELVWNGLKGGWPFRISKSELEKIEQALSRVKATHLLDRSLRELSGGELQRVYLARAFIQNRKILILDEPTTGIDSFGEQDLYELLEDFKRETGTTIMMVTHDIDVARHHSSHVLVMNRKQLSFGPPQLSLEQSIIERAFGHSHHHHSETCGHV